MADRQPVGTGSAAVADQAPDDGWDARGTWASLHILGVLETDADPTLSALVRVAARATGAPVTLWLRDGPGWRLGVGFAGDGSEMVRDLGSGGDHGTDPGPDTGTGIGGDHASDGAAGVRVPLRLDGLVVGEVRGAHPHRAQLEITAVEVTEVLDARWRARRRDAMDRPVGVVLIDDQALVRWLSPEMDELAGSSSRGFLGRSVFDLVRGSEIDAAAPLVDNVIQSRGRTASVPVTLLIDPDNPEVFDVQAENRAHDPDVRGRSFVVRPVADADDDLALLGHQMWVLNRLFNGRPLAEVLGRIVELVEQMKADGDACVMLLDAEGSALEPTFAPNLPAAVIDSLGELRIGADAPAGGASAQFAMPQYTADVRTARTWGPVRDALVAHDYLACWSTPIISTTQDRVLGSIDVYRRTVGQPTASETRVMIMAVRLAALAIDQEAHEWQMRHAATHDPLTALPNRTLFAERLAGAAPDGNLAVLFLDLDRFKLVNDTLGHEFGDDLLRAVGDRLADAVHEPSLVSRFGGDEFTVLVPKVEHLDDAVTEAERLLALLSEPYVIRGQRVSIGASAGVAVAVGPDDDPSALVRNADAALYRAKELGRGRVKAFDDRILAVAAQRVRVERGLRDALDSGSIEVMFQPSIRIADGSVVGVEALARCATPSGEMISPLSFIPVAEECSLISRVFDTVLAESCRVANLWNAGRARPIVVWVNLSPLQLGSIDLVDQVRRAFERSGVDPTTIGFEVTEQGVLADPNEARNRLTALVDLGAHAALDDFGTGHSSLSHLQDLPVDTVKLDRSFVIRAIEDARSRAIVGGVVYLAEAMGLHSVAEGVETPAQLEAVRDLGCHTVQGYIYSRPRSAADLGSWLAGRPLPAD